MVVTHCVGSNSQNAKIMKEKNNIITRREYLDICIQVLAGDSANPYGDEKQRVRRTFDKVNFLLDELCYGVEE